MTTTTLGEQGVILTRLNDLWDGPLPVAWPGVPFDTEATPHIEPRINTQPGFNADISTSRRTRHPGLLTLNIRATLPKGGNGAILAIGDTLAAIFRNVTVSGLTFRVPTIRDVGPNGTHYLVQVDCPYHRDSIF